jgi:hypothetical protein
MTTELVVKTIQFIPAKVEFNAAEISSVLDQNLAKYKGLAFTEDTVGECKKTIAELRKGKTMLDTYRKDTKKQLTESVTAFEKEIKVLEAKFDSVITPLVEQADVFEQNRREAKREEMQKMIDHYSVNLSDAFKHELIIPEEYYNKGKSLKDISKELGEKAQLLEAKQAKFEADVQLISSMVELANATHKLTLDPEAYTELIGLYSIPDIKLRIEQSAERLVAKATQVEKTDVLTQVPEVKVAPPLFPKSEGITVFKIHGNADVAAKVENYLNLAKIQYEKSVL